MLSQTKLDIKQILENSLHEVKNHVHHLKGFYVGGKFMNYSVGPIGPKGGGTGKIHAPSELVALSVKLDMMSNGEYDQTSDYDIALFDPAPKGKRNGPPSRRMIGGAPFPVDMSPFGCDDLQLTSIVPVHRRETAIYTEPISRAIKHCGYIAMSNNYTQDQFDIARDFLLLKFRAPAQQMQIALMDQNRLVFTACSKGAPLHSTFEDFRQVFEDSFVTPGAGGDPFVQLIIDHGNRISRDSWNDGSFELSIILDHLYSHAYAHNGLDNKDEIIALIQLFGEVDLLNASIVHSLLHTYDSLYMLERGTDKWDSSLDLLRVELVSLVPDETERRCLFRLLNTRAGEFLEIDSIVATPDGSVVQYRLPYTITKIALNDKIRQYESSLDLIPELQYQIMNPGYFPPRTGSTSKLPNT